jgi:predicted Zn-dependent protease
MRTFILYAGIILISCFSCKKRDPAVTKGEGVSPVDFLSSKNYDKLIIEIDYVSGYEPNPASINALSNFLSTLINKPNGIEIKKSSISSPGKNVYTLDDITALESKYREEVTKKNVITAYFLFLDNNYADPNVLGVNYRASSMAIFEKKIKELSGGLTQPSTELLEETVIEHEFGHVLGLTNNGTALQSAHQDAPHGAHCTNKNCLMYWAVETSDVINNLLSSGNPPPLDAACIADLKANNGK